MKRGIVTVDLQVDDMFEFLAQIERYDGTLMGARLSTIRDNWCEVDAAFPRAFNAEAWLLSLWIPKDEVSKYLKDFDE